MKTGTQKTPFAVNGWLQTGLAVGLLINLNPAGRAADWPQYRGANHDGISTEKVLTQWPADGLRTLWRVPLNTGFSTFTVAQGKAFTLVRRSIDGVEQEVCLGLDATTGKELWVAPLGPAKYQDGGDSGAADNRGGDGPRSTPTIDDGRVYLLSANLTLSCVDGSTGKTLWSKDIPREYGGKVIAWQNAASPLIDGDLVFVAGTGEGQSLLAFHKGDGSLAWKGQNDKMTQGVEVIREKISNNTRKVTISQQVSLPLKELMQKMNRESNNLYAEHFCKAIGNGSAKEGSDKIEQFLKEKGIAAKVRDGAGLARSNLITPRGFTTLLSLIQKDPLYRALYLSFPQPEEPGTLKSFKKLSQASLKAKTGVMTGISCLGGYLILQSGKEYAFSVLCNNYDGTNKEVRNEVYHFLEYLVQFLEENKMQ